MLQKYNIEDFELNDQVVKKSFDEVNRTVALKSNIKDVCALLDMKSSKYSSNQTVDQIYENTIL